MAFFFCGLFSCSIVNLIYVIFNDNDNGVEKITHPGPNIVFYFLVSFFCLADFILFSIIFNIAVCKKCCDKCFSCCNKDTNTGNKINEIPKDSSSGDINKTLQKNPPKPLSLDPIIIPIADNINIIFKLTSGREIKINAPSFITIEKLIKFIFKNVKIEGPSIDIIFLFKAEVLNKLSQVKLIDKFNNNDIILMRDTNNVVQFMEGKLELIYNEY